MPNWFRRRAIANPSGLRRLHLDPARQSGRTSAA
jgi:hypothetical protein